MLTAYITTAGIAAAEAAVSGGTQIILNSAQLSSDILNPSKAAMQAITVMPDVIYTANAAQMSYHIIDSNNIMMQVYLDNTVGDFNFGSFSLNLDDGTPFVVATYDTLQSKQTTQLRYLQVIITYTNLDVIVNLTILTSNDMSLPEVGNETQLPTVATAPYPVYFVHAWNAYKGRPALASRLLADGAWHFYPDHYGNYGVDTGTANSLVVNLSPTPNALSDLLGSPIVVKVANNNTGASTITINSFAATSIVDLNGNAVVNGQILAGSLVSLVYDGTYFQLLTPQTIPSSLYALDTGSTNALVATFSPAPETLASLTGIPLFIKIANINTSATTINVNSLGVKNLINLDGTALIYGELLVGSIVAIVYDGTNFYLLTPQRTQFGRYAADTGSVNAFAATLSPAPPNFASLIGVPIYLKTANGNTSYATFNPNGLGAVSVVNMDSSQLIPGQIGANSIILLEYDGTNFQLLTPLPRPLRVRLQNDLYLYVNSSTGNDSNDGLTTGTAFATIQHAWDYLITNVDMNNHSVFVVAADGTYTKPSGTSVLYAQGYPLGYGANSTISFTGNNTSYDSCLVSAVNANCFVAVDTAITISGFKLTATGTITDYASAGCCLLVFNGSIEFNYIDFGYAGYSHMYSGSTSFIACVAGGTYAITAGAPSHMTASTGHLQIIDAAITITGTPNFSNAFVYINGNVLVNIWGNTWNSNPTGSGLATGYQYLAYYYCTIQTLGAGSSYLPGNIAGILNNSLYE